MNTKRCTVPSIVVLHYRVGHLSKQWFQTTQITLRNACKKQYIIWKLLRYMYGLNKYLWIHKFEYTHRDRSPVQGSLTIAIASWQMCMFLEKKFKAVLMAGHGAVHKRSATILLHWINIFYKKTSTRIQHIKLWLVQNLPVLSSSSNAARSPW